MLHVYQCPTSNTECAATHSGVHVGRGALMSEKDIHKVSLYDTVRLCVDKYEDHAQSVEKEHIGFCCRTLGVNVGSLSTEAQDMLRLLLMCDDVGLMPHWPTGGQTLICGER